MFTLVVNLVHHFVPCFPSPVLAAQPVVPLDPDPDTIYNLSDINQEGDKEEKEENEGFTYGSGAVDIPQ